MSSTGKANSRLKTTTIDGERFAGSFAPAGSGVPTALYGENFTAAYGGAAGKFKVTINGTFRKLVSETYSRSFPAATLQAWSLAREGVPDITSVPGKTIITLAYVQNGALADIAADPASRVSFDLEVEP